ncbi:hypothetical protein Pint_10484 [Pistacia integerrima]|uniref:Uncharacterized protein n=2 Tax=Pistacia TaxID=55512 RepID=A0ACC1A6I1_9ROSI|nr:hypothetical protein Pint_10484 [Pistacia integerrima]KAJ0082422.1 hypothetical protein Patl1_10616 [Pistacia atlantica]
MSSMRHRKSLNIL